MRKILALSLIVLIFSTFSACNTFDSIIDRNNFINDNYNQLFDNDYNYNNEDIDIFNDNDENINNNGDTDINDYGDVYINDNGGVDTNDNGGVDTNDNGGVDTNDNGGVDTNDNGDVDINDNGDVDTNDNGGVDINDNGDVDTNDNGGVDINDNGDVDINDNGDVDINDNGDVDINDNGGNSVVPLQDLHLIDDDAYYYEKGIEDTYGNYYEGPYYEFCSYNRNTGELIQNHMTFYTNGKYERLTGTFFARPRQSDNYTIELLIYADGELIYNSEPINRKTHAIDLDININYCDELLITALSYDYTSTGTNPGVFLVNANVYK